jgi:hypothetical protein
MIFNMLCGIWIHSTSSDAYIQTFFLYILVHTYVTKMMHVKAGTSKQSNNPQVIYNVITKFTALSL